jgi:hypothetical protein
MNCVLQRDLYKAEAENMPEAPVTQEVRLCSCFRCSLSSVCTVPTEPKALRWVIAGKGAGSGSGDALHAIQAAAEA